MSLQKLQSTWGARQKATDDSKAFASLLQIVARQLAKPGPKIGTDPDTGETIRAEWTPIRVAKALGIGRIKAAGAMLRLEELRQQYYHTPATSTRHRARPRRAQALRLAECTKTRMP